MRSVNILRKQAFQDYIDAAVYRRLHPGPKSDLAVDMAFVNLRLLDTERA